MKQVTLPIQSFVSDSVSLITGLFFIYVGFLVKQDGENTILGEPLLNGNVTSEDAESNKSKGDANGTPFSMLEFSLFLPLVGWVL